MSRLDDAPNQLDSQALSETGESVLARSLALLAQNDADFEAVAEAWPRLADALKAAIVAIVRSAER